MLRKLILLGLIAGACSFALTSPTSSKPPKGSAKDRMYELAWLVGGWRGEAFGGMCEEVWLPAAGGKMIGTFRMINRDGVGFYEFMTIENGTEGHTLRLKHFNSDLTGWEAQNEVVEFGPGEVGPGAASFPGLAYHPIGEDSLLIVLEDEQEDGSVERVELRFGRVNPFF